MYVSNKQGLAAGTAAAWLKPSRWAGGARCQRGPAAWASGGYGLLSAGATWPADPWVAASTLREYARQVLPIDIE